MKPEIAILKLFLNHEAWVKYAGNVVDEDFPDDLKLLYKVIDTWHKGFTTNLSVLDLSTLVFQNNPKDKEYYYGVLDHLENTEIQPEAAIGYIESLKQNRILKELSITSYEVAEGKKDRSNLDSLLEKLQQPLKLDDTHNFITDDLEVLISSCVTKPGLRWRLNCLNVSLGSLRPGDFGFLFARPEVGKTTFLASEVSYMLGQLVDRPCLWINNEEQGDKVMLRLYQALLGVTMPELYSNIPKHQQKFNSITKGLFKLYDNATTTKWEIERLCQTLNPGLIVIDQIDKITGFKADREDLMLGSIYQWARELAKKYCPVIGVCQADGSGEGVANLTMANVANAKTAKQAEADWILGIGKKYDAGWENVRFLNISKNKLFGDVDSDPTKKHGSFQALIDPTIARYRDI